MGAKQKFNNGNFTEEGQRFKEDRKDNADGGKNRNGRTGNEHELDKIFKAVAGPEFPGDKRVRCRNGACAQKGCSRRHDHRIGAGNKCYRKSCDTGCGKGHRGHEQAVIGWQGMETGCARIS